MGKLISSRACSSSRVRNTRLVSVNYAIGLEGVSVKPVILNGVVNDLSKSARTERSGAQKKFRGSEIRRRAEAALWRTKVEPERIELCL
jgi:NADH:ubiquinone oxidoreductase subunit 4 (subunit M)